MDAADANKIVESVPNRRPQSVAEVIAELLSGLKSQPGCDVELVAILERYVLREQAPNDSVDQAVAEIERLAEARAQN